MSTSKPVLTAEDYHVGIVCALEIELAAVQAMRDEKHSTTIQKDSHDNNTYSFGQIQGHNVVIACLPAGDDGLAAAANVAKDMRRSFGHLRFGLLVGIGGGMPDLDKSIDVRLGDVVVSRPDRTSGGVIQHDKGKAVAGGEFQRKGALNRPPTVLLTALRTLQAQHLVEDSQVAEYLADMFEKYPKMKRKGFACPGHGKDFLFNSTYEHKIKDSTCENCDAGQRIERTPRPDDNPEIHYGIIISGNQVIKDPEVRDSLRHEYPGALCVEMEAAGLMNEFPCLVIRGICDYADSHKNDQWRGYAAATAAAYAKEILQHVSVEDTNRTVPIQDVLKLLSEQHHEMHDHHVRQYELNQRREVRDQDEEHYNCHQAFKTTNYAEEKERNVMREPGTGEWVLRHKTFQTWITSGKDDLLWISADPGCGKSVLSRSLVDQDLQSCSRHAKPTILYFFFKDNETQGNLTTALCALLHQLFVQQPQLLSHAISAWKANGSKLQQESTELWRILLNACNDPIAGNTICVLDALDECKDNDRKKFMTMLRGFYKETAHASSEGGCLKFLITSRPYSYIEEGFQELVSSLPSIHLRGEDEDTQLRSEIDIVVQSRINKFPKTLLLSDEIKHRLEKKLLGMQNRTYLWLHLVFDSIPKIMEHSLDPQKENFDSIPTTVDAAYEQILSRIAPDLETRVQKILLIIVGAPRPLTIGEMALALDVAVAPSTLTSFSQFSINPEYLATKIRDWCGLFVFLNHNKLYLIHQTAKEFLVNNLEQDRMVGDRWKYCFRPQDIDAEVSRVYMQYLCLDDFEEKSSDLDHLLNSYDRWSSQDQILEALEKNGAGPQYTLFFLAAKHWARHWRSIEQLKGDGWTRELQILYDLEGRRCRQWLLAASFNKQEVAEFNKLLLAARTGHCIMMKQFLSSELRNLLDARDYSGMTPLMNASYHGHKQVVQLLLEHGADVNLPNGHYGSAPGAAACWGHESIVRLLLEQGADVDIADDWDGSPLHAARARIDAIRQSATEPESLLTEQVERLERIVELLVEHGARDIPPTSTDTESETTENNVVDETEF